MTPAQVIKEARQTALEETGTATDAQIIEILARIVCVAVPGFSPGFVRLKPPQPVSLTLKGENGLTNPGEM